MQTNTNLKALTYKPQLMPTAKLLLDECVTMRLERFKQSQPNVTISDSVKVLGPGTKDEAIKEYAKQTGHILVTRDFKLACKCLDQNVKTAFYYNGKAYVLAVETVLALGEEMLIGAPFYATKRGVSERNRPPGISL